MKEFILATCGIILFLIGMIRLSSIMRKLINARIKLFIKYAAERPVYGLLTGIFSTVFFQSSSASTALTIGLVSAGLISFYSSLAIILGADIGTTLTVQFVVWRFTEFSPLIISLGGLLWLTRRDRWNVAGQMIFYFGLLFFGLDLVSQASAPLKNSPVFLNFFAQTKSPLFGIGVGMVFTGIVHASSIPIGLLVILAQQDLVLLENAIPVIMGANIGTTVTALLAGTVANVSGKRSAISHLIFKSMGVAICFVFMPGFIHLLKYLSSSTAQQIVLAHFILNLAIVLMFIFLLKPFAQMMNNVLPGRDETMPLWPEFLDERDLSDTEKALDDVKSELQREIGIVVKMFSGGISSGCRQGNNTKKDISYIEMVVNNLRTQIVKFLWKISAGQLSTRLSRKLFAFTAIADDIESIGNHIVCLTELISQRASRKIKFSESGERDLKDIITLVRQNLDDARSLINTPNDEIIKNILLGEEEVDIKVKDARERHLKRFHNRLCLAEAGPVFVEMLIHLERISDHCTNIAEYISDIKEKNSPEK